jgi:hypothetical protein
MRLAFQLCFGFGSWLGRLMAFLSTSRKIWENIGAELPIVKWETIPSLHIVGNVKIIAFGAAQTTQSKKKNTYSEPKHSGRLRQDCEIENKFQEELMNPALPLHRFPVAYYTSTKPVMINIAIFMVIWS